MPKRVEKAKIALLDASIENEKPEMDAKINIESPEQIEAFLNQEEAMLKGMVDKILASGANVVFAKKASTTWLNIFLPEKESLQLEEPKKSDMEKLARATGGKILSNINALTSFRPWLCCFG